MKEAVTPPAKEPAKTPAKDPLDDLFGDIKDKPAKTAPAPAKDAKPVDPADIFAPKPEDKPATPAAPKAPAAPGKVKDPFETRHVPAMRQWVDNTGNFRVTARLVAILDGQVRLHKENGKTTTVPMRRLSDTDRQYVEQLAAELGQGEVIYLASR